MKLSRRIEEEILLLKIKHGDQQAFVVLYERYVDPLFRFVAYRVRSQELAQDITSELFLKVWQRLTAHQARVQNLRAFLYQVARNLIADHYRSQQATLPLEEAAQVASTEAGSEVTIDLKLSLAEVEQGLKELKGEWQEVVLLAYVEGLKPAEIALIIEKTPAATRVMLHRALKELKRLLKK